MATVSKYLKSFHLEVATALKEPPAAKNTLKLSACAIKKRVIFPTGQAILASDDLDPRSQLWLRRSQNLRKAKQDGFVFISLTDTSAFCRVGVEARVLKSINLDDGDKGYVVKGVRRLLVDSVAKRKNGGYDSVVRPVDSGSRLDSPHLLRQFSNLKTALAKMLKLNDNIDNNTRSLLLNGTEDPRKLCDLIASHLTMTYEEQLEVLSASRINARLKLLTGYLQREVEMLKYSSHIQKKVEDQISETERANFIREQIKTLQDELAELDGSVSEIKALTREVEKMQLPQHVREVINLELEKLDLAPCGSTEYMISHQYLMWLRDLPWPNPDSRVSVLPDLDKASKVLNKNHYGLTKIKERILEHLAVIIYKKKIDGQILLFVGPPGTGKTSLVKSIADALGRKFIQISLGGMKEEIEIRGLRRTYVGAMPGKIIQAIKQAGDNSAVMLLDEIDKVGSRDRNNDVQASLLEVLDYHHNSTYRDHYLDIPFDLSQILFVATANTVEDIPAPLLSRMEVIELSTYSSQEKIKIARKHLLPCLRGKLRIDASLLNFDNDAILDIIKGYTQEAGVRQLTRKLEDIGRKIIKSHLAQRTEIPATIGADQIANYLGNPLYQEEPRDRTLPSGVAIGLAYTAVGGEIMYVETTIMRDRNGGLTLTGFLGKVMQESASMAKSFIAAQADTLGIDPTVLETSRIHVHLPDGATPKDGPSAGLAILLAMTGLLKKQKIKASVAVTGEITLRGQVLPVGGIKEKILAAFRYQKREIILPEANLRDLLEVPSEVLRRVTFHPVSTMTAALTQAGLLPLARPVPGAMRLRKSQIVSLLKQKRL